MSDRMENDKYVVFKYDEFVDWHDKNVGPNANTPRRLHDAVVIRPQDIFAGPGLSAYAAAIQTAIDLITAEPNKNRPITEGQRVLHLEELRDFFHEQAEIAFLHPNKKVPD